MRIYSEKVSIEKLWDSSSTTRRVLRVEKLVGYFGEVLFDRIAVKLVSRLVSLEDVELIDCR